MTKEWHDVWRFPTPKEKVALLLEKSLNELRRAAVAEGSNAELWLLSGLVAHYAYNVDVEGSYELAMKSFDVAKKLAPDDYRSSWFARSTI